jgi:hypothetical protein
MDRATTPLLDQQKMESNKNTSLDSFKSFETPKTKPTVKVRVNRSPPPPTIKEVNDKVDLILKAAFHIIHLESKILEDKHNDAVRERERRY